MNRTRFAYVTLALCFIAAPRLVATAGAQTPPAVQETHGQLAASVNNSGLQQSLDWSWRRPLFRSANPLLTEAHISAGALAAITPASVRGGAWVEIAPVSFFVLRAGVDPAHYFGTFDAITSFDRADAAFDDTARKQRASAHSGQTRKFYVSPTLQLRAGRVAGQTSLDLEQWSSSAAGPYFYEPTRDTLLAVSGDHLMTSSTAVVYELPLERGGTLAFGPVHSLSRVNGAHLNQIQRLGALVMHQSVGRHFGVVAPRTTLVLTRYLDDPSKRGQWSAAVAVGFSLKRR